MNKGNLFIVLVVALLLSGIGINKYLSKQYEITEGVQFDLLTFKVENGWGYEIYVNGKRFIYQDQIPSIEQSAAFTCKNHAQLVGSMVLQKIKKHQNPSVQKKELIQWGILDANGKPVRP